MNVLRSLVSESWAGGLASQSDTDASASRSPHGSFELDRHADEHSHSQSATGHRNQRSARQASEAWGRTCISHDSRRGPAEAAEVRAAPCPLPLMSPDASHCSPESWVGHLVPTPCLGLSRTHVGRSRASGRHRQALGASADVRLLTVTR